jgi:hypothetical protein
MLLRMAPNQMEMKLPKRTRQVMMMMRRRRRRRMPQQRPRNGFCRRWPSPR